MTEEKSVKIPSSLYEQIVTRIKSPQIGFDTVDEYVTFVIESVLQDKEISDDEEKRVQEELKKLGYI